ncbi:purine nucleoside phosphorylase-like [Actinia tenebrosa]|uniref:Purine nucleoside phosphorylase n=1 Tax=Actinia tenebrosa TaxID=6105 RepID=A0A6P8H7X1_ACTTE|nr:purine nucleoside phosphorylase-like [Actinia tenebrosa]
MNKHRLVVYVGSCDVLSPKQADILKFILWKMASALKTKERRFEYSHSYDEIEEVCKTIANQTKYKPTIGVICGSGLSALGDLVQEKDVIPYDKIPLFPKSTVPGHAGQLVFGKLNGKIVVMMQGRSHLYEGYEPGEITLPVRVMALLGVKTLVVTNAAGGISKDWNVGDIMIIQDHINLAGLTGHSPLRGFNDPRLGPRFPALSDAYDKKLQKLAKATAEELGYQSFVRKGVYCAQVGPAFETPAECRYIKSIGADAVGMSTVHEVVVARHSGIKVLGISLITNIVVSDYDDESEGANHAEVLETGRRRASDMQRLVSTILHKMVE